MLEVDIQVRVGVVEHVVLEPAFGACELRGGVGAYTFTKPGGAAAEEPQLAVRVETAVADPAAEDQVEPGNPVGAEFGLAAQHLENLILQFGSEDFVGVEKQNPVGGAEVEGDVFLFAVATEGMVGGLCAKRLGDFESAVLRAGVDEDDFVGLAHALQGAGKVGLLVHGDHGY